MAQNTLFFYYRITSKNNTKFRTVMSKLKSEIQHLCLCNNLLIVDVQLCITNVANPQLSQTINLMLKSHHFFCSEFIFNITVSVNINIYFRNQKRVLEEKLRALEAEHAASKHLADSRPAPTVIHGQPPPQRTG
jgi:hypothetical protein